MDGKYNIKAVSKLLGIQAGTLRAWERRYKIIEPVRNQAGHRLYTEEQVAILKWLIRKINSGFTIGQAVDILEKEEMVSVFSDDTYDSDQLNKLKREILLSLLNFEEGRCNQLLDQAFAIYSMEKVVIHILGPIMIEVGDKWEKGEITIANEHFATSYVRTRIGMVFQHLPVDGLLPKVLCVCTPKELHEIGLLIFTFYLKRRGFDTIYLGSGIPEVDIIQVAYKIKPKMIFLSCTMEENIIGTLEIATTITNEFNNEIKVGIGGSGTEHLLNKNEDDYEQFLVGKTEEEWETWLKDALT
ncbi:MerR family transcriptional regulator [Evansella tamaricis]|uniref:MerR family transcriptional regulator n=1 Tax=Evansella tamaricis TaxID=2069301 RepID=A0ABS6JL08_9BACI|nr:B12-binding domain-containing protein [Evansella tamaricis]MBU9714266.1 MerR family transcriptional regulator [Evansella tamaricis]